MESFLLPKEGEWLEKYWRTNTGRGLVWERGPAGTPCFSPYPWVPCHVIFLFWSTCPGDVGVEAVAEINRLGAERFSIFPHASQSELFKSYILQEFARI